MFGYVLSDPMQKEPAAADMKKGYRWSLGWLASRVFALSGLFNEPVLPRRRYSCSKRLRACTCQIWKQAPNVSAAVAADLDNCKQRLINMPLYEHTFLARHDLSAQQMEALMEKFTSVLKENGGRVAGQEYWGLKPLAYRIKKHRKAHFGFLQVDTPPAAIAEMERQMGLSNDVLRFLTVRVDAQEALPSAMMRKSDREERKGRRGGRFEDFGDDEFKS